MGIDSCIAAPWYGTGETMDITKDRINGNNARTPYMMGTAPRTPFETLTSALPFPAPSASTQYWWEKVGPSFSTLLSRARYPVQSQYEILLFLHTHLLPLLGPRPPPENEDRPSTLNAPWRSFVTDDFSPFEPSWNVCGDRSTIRLSIEPVGFRAGTDQDPFNQSTPTACMRQLAASQGLADLVFFEHFVSHFHISEDPAKVAKVQSKLPEGEHMSQCFIAFDFEHTRWSIKAYFFPILKALETDKSTAHVVTDSIRSLAPKTSWGNQMVAATSALEDWLADYRGEAKVEFISVDCVDEAKSRIKIYVRVPFTSLRRVKDAYCLGGRLQDKSTGQGLEVLDNLWRSMFGLPSHATEDEELPATEHRTAGTIFNFELRPGKWLPDPKVYLPVHHYCSSDTSIAERLQEYFGKMRWHHLAKEYKNDIENAFPHHPLSKTAGTHTYVSFSYKEEKGVYMTMYYNPRFYSV